ncbi:hypothetical protein Tco_0243047 [Tanacetum coccineum]
MGIPNEHQLKFNSIKDAKSLLQTVEKRFGVECSTYKGAVATTHGATTASTLATTVNLTTIDNLSDAVICAFFVADSYANNEGKEILEEHLKESLESVEARLLVYKKNESVSKMKIISYAPKFKKPVVVTSETKASEAKPKAVRKKNGAPIIED